MEALCQVHAEKNCFRCIVRENARARRVFDAFLSRRALCGRAAGATGTALVAQRVLIVERRARLRSARSGGQGAAARLQACPRPGAGPARAPRRTTRPTRLTPAEGRQAPQKEMEQFQGN